MMLGYSIVVALLFSGLLSEPTHANSENLIDHLEARQRRRQHSRPSRRSSVLI